jgi:hypothetical protein
LALILVALLAVPAGALGQQLAVGEPFAFTTDPDAVGIVSSVLARSGAAWTMAAEPSSVECPGPQISAVAPDGIAEAWIGYIPTPAGRSVPGPFVHCPVSPATLVAAGSSATVAWITATGEGTSHERYEIYAQQCSLRGECLDYPARLVASWPSTARVTTENSNLPPAVWPQPALASSGSSSVLVFDSFGGPDQQMMWAQGSASSVFAPVHSFGVGGDWDPVAVSEPGGRVFAAWFEGIGSDRNALYSSGVRIAYAQYTPGHGFGAVHATAAGKGSTCTQLAIAPTSSGVTLAWLQGNTPYGSGTQFADPLWTLTVQGDHASKAKIADARASTFSLGGGGDVVALAPWYRGDGANPALVQTSVDGQPFAAPVELDPNAGPAEVGVDSNGDTLATWFAGPSTTSTDGSEELAVAAPGAAFSAPVELMLPVAPAFTASALDGTPAVHLETVGSRSLITSMSGYPPLQQGQPTIYGVIVKS